MKNQQKIQITLYRNLDFSCVACSKLSAVPIFPGEIFLGEDG